MSENMPALAAPIKSSLPSQKKKAENQYPRAIRAETKAAPKHKEPKNKRLLFLASKPKRPKPPGPCKPIWLPARTSRQYMHTTQCLRQQEAPCFFSPCSSRNPAKEASPQARTHGSLKPTKYEQYLYRENSGLFPVQYPHNRQKASRLKRRLSPAIISR